MSGSVVAAGSLAVVHATAVTLEPLARRRSDLGSIDADDLGVVRDATIVIDDGVIRSVTSRGAPPAAMETIDAGGRLVMPGLVDAHTHALFAGDRVEDFEAIAAGRPPRLGIRYTVAQTRACSPDDLIRIGADRLSLMAAHGTTTAEVKTGYALDVAGEVRLLEALAALGDRADMPHVVPTFCGAHALPPEFSDFDAFVDALVSDFVPAVAQSKIARFADAFCERGYFTPEQSRRFLTACASAGMGLRIHADELAHSGGAALAAELRCASADHLNFIDDADVAALARAGCVAVLCPATTEYLGLERFAPARRLLAEGVPVALATDFNPGTCPCPSLQTVAYLARRRLGMTAPETIAAVTLFAARSLSLPHAGSIIAGASADIAILETADFREFGYYFGVNLVRSTIVGRRSVILPAV